MQAGEGGDGETAEPAPVPFQAIVEASVSPFVVVDGKGFVRWAGPAVRHLLGRPAEEFVGTHFLDVLHPSSHEAAIAAFRDFTSQPSVQQPWVGPPMLLDLIGADGPVTCEVSASSGAATGTDGAVLQVRRWRGAVLLYQAVDAIAAGAPLADVLWCLATLLEHDLPNTSVAVGTGRDGTRFESVVAGGDPTVAELTSGPASPAPWGDATAKDEIVGPADLDGLAPDVAAAAAARGYSACWAFPVHVRADATPTAAVVAWRRLPGPAVAHLTTTATRVARLVALAVEAERTRATWERAARTDDLTGLSKRSDLVDRLDRLAEAAPDRSIAALFCDLDDFKPVNDNLGHDAGDRVLADVASRIRRAVRPSDVVARWGGDEFVVLCTESTSSDDAVGIARRLVDEVNRPYPIGDGEVHLGLSVGVAIAPAGRAHDIVRRADAALASAKAAGKNQWRVADAPLPEPVLGSPRAGRSSLPGGAG
jgi:diguanylate cyclase (GGDEF)-like protein